MNRIDGLWYNEIKSKMVIHVNGKHIKGKYTTKVGDAEGEYDLIGQIDTDRDASTSIGWVVLWNNENGSSDAVTSWSGQVQKDDNGELKIITTWLLTQETDTDNIWSSTRIGQDVFTRNMPQSKNSYSNSSPL